MRHPALAAVMMVAVVSLPAVAGRAPAQPPSASRPATAMAVTALPADLHAHPGNLSIRPISAPQVPPAPRIVLGAITSRPLVALTFDLDMTPTMAAQLRSQLVSGWINQDALGYLQTTGTHATIFMTGMWAEQYPTLARRIAQQPQFELANHSYSHAAFHRPCYLLGGAGASGIRWEVAHAQQVLQRITGVTPRYFRFPGGCYDRAAVDAVLAYRLTPVEWTVNSTDAFNRYPGQIAATVVSNVKPGAIVVMHLHGGPNAPATGEALRLIVPELARRGYQFVTVSELLQAGPALQPSDPREVVEAYQPAPAPTSTPTLRPPLIYRSPPPCWRWDVRLRLWVRC